MVFKKSRSRGSSESKRSKSAVMKTGVMNFLATDVLKSGDSTNRRKSSYTIWRWGQASSSMGSSSSGLKASPAGLTGGGRERKRFDAYYFNGINAKN